MNTIEQLVEALKSCTEDEYGQHFHQTQVEEAIAAGEQELNREPDGFLLTYTQTGASTLRRTRPTKWERASWTFKPAFVREEIK